MDPAFPVVPTWSNSFLLGAGRGVRPTHPLPPLGANLFQKKKSLVADPVSHSSIPHWGLWVGLLGLHRERNGSDCTPGGASAWPAQFIGLPGNTPGRCGLPLECVKLWPEFVGKSELAPMKDVLQFCGRSHELPILSDTNIAHEAIGIPLPPLRGWSKKLLGGYELGDGKTGGDGQILKQPRNFQAVTDEAILLKSTLRV